MDNFDLKNYLKNNTLLNEGVEEKEEVKEEVKTEGYGKMKKSELKEKIREEILEAMAKDEEPVHEADEDEDIAPEVDADIDVDADVEIEEPEADDFAGSETVEDVRKEMEDGFRAVGRAAIRAGEQEDQGAHKMAIDGLSYTRNEYPEKDPFGEEGI